jgi:hypothetical protein
MILVSLVMIGCEWLNEDPGAGREDRYQGPSGREIISRLGQESGHEEAEMAQDPEESEQVPSENEAAAELDLSGSFPTAMPIEGDPRFVRSPYDGARINVEGIKSGSLVADPRFPRKERKFFLVP